MPLYSYICGKCQGRCERFAHMAASGKQRCDKGCDGYLYIDWAMQGLNAPKVGDHEWHGKESKSLSLAFDPRKLGELRRDVPSLELHGDGSVKFKSNSHQRKVYREMEAATRRLKEREEQANVGD
jgi:hypothetical protein